jgi:hypothetical protein
MYDLLNTHISVLYSRVLELQLVYSLFWVWSQKVKNTLNFLLVRKPLFYIGVMAAIRIYASTFPR